MLWAGGGANSASVTKRHIYESWFVIGYSEHSFYRAFFSDVAFGAVSTFGCVDDGFHNNG
jgi:hypothetical protein